VTSADVTGLAGCLAGSGRPLGAGCSAGDLDFDGDVDLRDVALFQTLLWDVKE